MDTNVQHLQALVSVLLSHVSEHIPNQFGFVSVRAYPSWDSPPAPFQLRHDPSTHIWHYTWAGWTRDTLYICPLVLIQVVLWCYGVHVVLSPVSLLLCKNMIQQPKDPSTSTIETWCRPVIRKNWPPNLPANQKDHRASTQSEHGGRKGWEQWPLNNDFMSHTSYQHLVELKHYQRAECRLPTEHGDYDSRCYVQFQNLIIRLSIVEAVFWTLPPLRDIL